jgi:hypothetical protein
VARHEILMEVVTLIGTAKRPSAGRRVLRASVPAALLAAVLVVAGTAGATLAAPGGQSDFAAIRAATAEFHDLSTAQAAGYGLLPGCYEHADGGMGIHYVRGDLLGDGAIDPLTPEALVYEPLPNGKLRLVAVEYVTFASHWASPPVLFGQQFSFEEAPNEFNVPVDFYELHVWLWQPNPSGMFYEWNPRVSCAYAD